MVAGIVAAEAISRLIHPPRVDGGPWSRWRSPGSPSTSPRPGCSHGPDRSSLNLQGAFRHVLTDLYGFIGTVIAGIVIVATGLTRADAIASLVVVALMVKAAWELLARLRPRSCWRRRPRAWTWNEVQAHLLKRTEHVR